MPPQARIGDKSQVPTDAHGCPACPHTAIGPAVQGSTNVITNGRPSVRVGDQGVHAACCGPNLWNAKTGSSTVLINGRPSHRLSDLVIHCGGIGRTVQGSPNVIVGDMTSDGVRSGSSSHSSGPPPPQQQVTWVAIELKSSDGEPMVGQTYQLTTPDGKVRQGTLDKNGRARVDHVKAGQCEISFPDLDGKDWSPA